MDKPWRYTEQACEGVGWCWSLETFMTAQGLFFPVFPDGCCDVIRQTLSCGKTTVRLLAPTQSGFLFSLESNMCVDGVRLLPEAVHKYTKMSPSDIPDEGLQQPLSFWDVLNCKLMERGQVCAVVSPLMCGEVFQPTRTLRRYAQRLTSCRPKELQRMWRLRRAVYKAVSQPSPNWTDIAFEAGFSDQAHMIRECRDLIGHTPKTIYNHMNQGDVAVSFNTPI
ncbi:MAG: helix-turn-helix domain-containing protein [Magnetovibrio sp.]|nr:helix-turn-helix domain-containing protein [Magnetovibrio sp.]